MGGEKKNLETSLTKKNTTIVSNFRGRTKCRNLQHIGSVGDFSDGVEYSGCRYGRDGGYIAAIQALVSKNLQV